MFGSAYKGEIRDVNALVVFGAEAVMPRRELARRFRSPSRIAVARSRGKPVSWRDLCLLTASPTSRLEHTRTARFRRISRNSSSRPVSWWRSSVSIIGRGSLIPVTPLADAIKSVNLLGCPHRSPTPIASRACAVAWPLRFIAAMIGPRPAVTPPGEICWTRACDPCKL